MAFTLNPMLTSNASGSFSIQSNGFTQGMAYDEPAVRFQLAGGVIDTNETYPMWGGVAISEFLPTTNADLALGNTIKRAIPATSSNVTNTISGFSVFNKASSWILTAQSNVPVGSAGQTASFYRLGSGAKIAVQCDTTLASTLLNGTSQTFGANAVQFSWDFFAQKLISVESTYTAAVAITGTPTISVSNGIVSVTLTTATNHGLSIGDWFTISGAVPVAYNGSFQAITGTNGTTTLKFNLPSSITTSPGAFTTLGQVNAHGGILNVDVVALNVGNSKVVTYSDPASGGNGLANWSQTGTVAIIQI